MWKAPEFWWRQKTGWQSVLLAVPSVIYGAISGSRMLQAEKTRLDIPVLCVGNFVVGGVGKTPFSMKLAALLKAQGHKPGFLLRGYGGREAGPLRVDPKLHDAEEVGDEALLLASLAPTVVAKDRAAGGHYAASQADIDVLIMDDGFQNPALGKDLSLVLVDSQTGLGNGWCFPAGPMRAPLRQQLAKTDVLVIVGAGPNADEIAESVSGNGIPVLHAEVKPLANPTLKDKPLVAYAGIGRPQKFFASLAKEELDVVQTLSFADHHPYSEQDADNILAEAERLEAVLVTTSKDKARLLNSRSASCRQLARNSMVFEIAMDVQEEALLIDLLDQALRVSSRRLKDVSASKYGS